MASNPIQFQRGMSLPDFLRYFGDEARCEDALARVRWPHGFICPACGTAPHCLVQRDRRRLYQCNACRHQSSLKAGTLFASTKLPLTRLDSAYAALPGRRAADDRLQQRADADRRTEPLRTARQRHGAGLRRPSRFHNPAGAPVLVERQGDGRERRAAVSFLAHIVCDAVHGTGLGISRTWF